MKLKRGSAQAPGSHPPVGRMPNAPVPQVSNEIPLPPTPARGEVLGYKIGDKVYHPADVTVIRASP